MIDILDRRFTPTTSTVDGDVGPETVILQLGSGNYFGLDPLGTRVWIMLKEGSTAREICERLAGDYNVEQEVFKADIRTLLAELASNDVISETK